MVRRRKTPRPEGAAPDPRGGARNATPGRASPEWVTRFWSKVEQKPGCWNWAAGRIRGGYGVFHLNGKLRKAHRVMWMLHHGWIPEGMSICHHCDNPSCVNPGHLFLGTHQDNMTDKMRKGRHVALLGERNPMWGQRKTHCKNGHQLVDDNVYLNRGQRHCRACRLERVAVQNARISAERRARRGQKEKDAA